MARIRFLLLDALFVLTMVSPSLGGGIPGGPGDMIVTMRNTDRVTRIDGLTGEQTYSFSFSNANLDSPTGITIGPDGLLYVAGKNTRNVVRFNLSTGLFVDVFVQPESGGLFAPQAIAFGPDNHLYVVDGGLSTGIRQIRKYSGSTGAYLGEFITAASGLLRGPTDLVFRGDGFLYVANGDEHCVRRFIASNGAFVGDFVTFGSGGLTLPTGLTFGPDNNLYVTSFGNQGTVFRYDGTTGAFIDVFVPPGTGGLRNPYGLDFGPDGDLYVSSELANSVLRYDGSTGDFVSGAAYGPQLGNSRYMLFDPVDCLADSQCSDGNAQTIDRCYGYECRHLPFSRLYVNDDATGTNNGLSWGNAFNDLQNALALAASTGGPLEIWVAEGTYAPDQQTGSRDATFELINSVTLLGGFAGTETNKDDRDYEAFPTILSGDLLGDDGPDFAANSENSYHVVTGTGTGLDLPAVLDGFHITAGNANGAAFEAPKDRGGGMVVFHGRPDVVNCTFIANSAGLGGGMACEDFARANILNTRFLGNRGVSAGGILVHSHSDINLTNCVFSGNTATDSLPGSQNLGGAVLIVNDCRPTFTNCTFAGNSAIDIAGGIHNGDAKTALTNCVLWGNTDASGTGQAAQVNGPANWMIDHCCIQGWLGNIAGSTNTSACDPQFMDSDGPDGIVGTIDDDLRPDPLSAVVDAGFNDADIDANLAGSQELPAETIQNQPRILNGVVDRGAYESCGVQAGTPVPAPPHDRLKNRYISFGLNGHCLAAFRINKVTAPVGTCWVGVPDSKGNAACVSAPVFRTWPEEVVHVGDCEIMPVAQYEIRATADGVVFTAPLVVNTIAEPVMNLKKWGDVAGVNNGSEWTPPNLFTNVNDILAVLAYISGAPIKPEFQRSNLQAISVADPCLNAFVNTADVLIAVKAVAGNAYPFTTNPANCPVCP